MNVTTCNQSVPPQNCGCDACSAISSISVIAGTLITGTLGGTVSNVPFNVVNPETGEMENINSIINDLNSNNNSGTPEDVASDIADNNTAMTSLVNAIVSNPTFISLLGNALISPDTTNSLVLDSEGRFYENDSTTPTT